MGDFLRKLRRPAATPCACDELTAKARRGRPRKIQPDDIVDVATGLIDRDGVDQFSMRALADAMGVRPMAFYTHFENRDALLDAVAERFLRSADLPAYDGVSWERFVIGFGEALRDAWTAHPRLLAVAAARPAPDSAVAELVNAFVATLVSAGFTHELAHSAWHAVQNHVIGEVNQEAAWRPQRSAWRREPEVKVARTTDDPSLAAVLAACDPAAEFRVGLELIVAGLRGRHDPLLAA